MINFHPDNALLAAYAADTLPLSMTLAVAIHVEFCPTCARRVADLERQLAESVLIVDTCTRAGGRAEDRDPGADILVTPCITPYQPSELATDGKYWP